MDKKYQKGQKIPVPRDLRPFIEDLISQRERYQVERTHEVATAFGFGAEEIGKGFQFALDYKENIAFAYDKLPTERIATASLDKIRPAIAKTIILDHANNIVVAILEATMESIARYNWRLSPKDMEVEILDAKSKPPINLAAVQDGGGVQ